MPIQGARALAEQRQASRALLLLTRSGPVSGQSAHDVSKFYRALLVDKALLTPSSVALMEQFELLSYGWAKVARSEAPTPRPAGYR